MKTSVKRSSMPVASLTLAVGLAFLTIVGIGGAATADTTYVPTESNGQRIYLSRSCHDPDLGPNCVTNVGCNNYSENARSQSAAVTLAQTLVSRGCPVRVGNNGAMANVASSNAWNATMHFPLHSNASGAGSCKQPPGLSTVRGTQPQYRGPLPRELAVIIRDNVGLYSPGDRDAIDFDNTNYENRVPDAVPVYLETEYHDWERGVTYLRSDSWIVSTITSIEQCRGYPRQGQGPTSVKRCSW